MHGGTRNVIWIVLAIAAVTEGAGGWHHPRSQPEDSAGDPCTPSIRASCGESSLVADAVEPAPQLRFG